MRRIDRLVLLAMVAALPGCQSPGPRWAERPPRRVVQRPVFDSSSRRPFVVSGYAGAVYGPGASRGAIEPAWNSRWWDR